MKLRGYQADIFAQLTRGASNDLVQLDTGAGKTPIEAALAEWAPLTLLVAHRNILIHQISEKLAAFGVEHDTISTEHTRRRCISAHRAHGRGYIKRGHPTHRVASIQSIAAALRHGRLDIDASLPWLIVIDEAHHVVPDNMWGALRRLFPNARIVGFTATPARMDGESLHVSKGGLFDRLVQAAELGDDSVRKLIDMGFLSGFAVYSAQQKIAEAEGPEAFEDRIVAEMLAAADGAQPQATQQEGRARRNRVHGLDWNSGALQIVGDPVAEYKRLAPGMRAIMMCPAIKNAEMFAQAFRDAGIPAACISSVLSPGEIARLIDAFRAGRIRVLTNVDMVGEGFDLPDCDALIIATRTASFPRYRQWCGRVLRPAPSKQRAIIIDHAGMCVAHGMPDEPVKWDLVTPPCGPLAPRHVPCEDCGLWFKFKLEACPECGWGNEWLNRSAGFNPGSYVFDVRVLDQALVARGRRERNAEAHERYLATELLPVPAGLDAGGLVGRTVVAIVRWFCARLAEEGVSTREINRFLLSAEARDKQFWIRSFTARDVSCAPAKPLKVFKKWQSGR